MLRYFMELDSPDSRAKDCWHVYDRRLGLGNHAAEHNAIATCRDADIAQRICDLFNADEADAAEPGSVINTWAGDLTYGRRPVDTEDDGLDT